MAPCDYDASGGLFKPVQCANESLIWCTKL